MAGIKKISTKLMNLFDPFMDVKPHNAFIIPGIKTSGKIFCSPKSKNSMVKGEYTTGGHTGVMVSIFAYGPGVDEFIGIMENTDLHAKMRKLDL